MPLIIGETKPSKNPGSIFITFSLILVKLKRSEPHHRRGSHPHPPRFFPWNDFVWPVGRGQKHHAALYVSWRGCCDAVVSVAGSDNLRGVCWPNSWLGYPVVGSGGAFGVSIFPIQWGTNQLFRVSQASYSWGWFGWRKDIRTQIHKIKLWHLSAEDASWENRLRSEGTMGRSGWGLAATELLIDPYPWIFLCMYVCNVMEWNGMERKGMECKVR